MASFAIGDYSELLTAMERSGGRSIPAVRAWLKHVRVAHLRESELVVRHGAKLVDKKGVLGDEYWSVLEQVRPCALAAVLLLLFFRRRRSSALPLQCPPCSCYDRCYDRYRPL